MRTSLSAQLRPRHPAGLQPLAGVEVLSVALNLPGPVALARLQALGARVVKVEPPAGDPMRSMSPPLYRAMHRGIDVLTLDLKTDAGRQALHQRLAGADLLLTAFRPAALARLGLAPDALRARHPRLSVVSIVGQRGRRAALAGHDLTYQAESGLIDTPRLPGTLLADMTGALLVVEAALAALLQRNASGAGVALEVALADAAAFAAAPRHCGLTAPGALLGGQLPGYAVYRCADGLVALAALEPHFDAALRAVVGGASRARLTRWCRAHTAAELRALADVHDLPLAAWAQP